MPLTNAQKLKTIGLSTYRPSSVNYAVSPNEFSELFAKYCNDYLKFETPLKFELKFVRNEANQVEDYEGELHIIDPDDILDDDYHRLVGMGMNENSDPEQNFVTAMNILFYQPDYWNISGKIDDTLLHCIFITCPYKDFVKFGAEGDLKVSETE